MTLAITTILAAWTLIGTNTVVLLDQPSHQYFRGHNIRVDTSLRTALAASVSGRTGTNRVVILESQFSAIGSTESRRADRLCTGASKATVGDWHQSWKHGGRFGPHTSWPVVQGSNARKGAAQASRIGRATVSDQCNSQSRSSARPDGRVSFVALKRLDAAVVARVPAPASGSYALAELIAPQHDVSGSNPEGHVNFQWNPDCWLAGAHGLSATSVCWSNVFTNVSAPGGQYPLVLVSPAHFVYAYHCGYAGQDVCWLDTNSVQHWRRPSQERRAYVGSDTGVGALDEPLPDTVEPLPLVPMEWLTQLGTDLFRGVGWNQNREAYPDDLTVEGERVYWNTWLVVGDSSCPVMVLLGDKLFLLSHAWFSTGGPCYPVMLDKIQEAMDELQPGYKLK